MNPIIEFVIPTFQRHYNLLVLINSIVVQTYDNWKIHIVSDGKDELKEEMIKPYLEKFSEKIKYSTIKGPNKDWGHTAREYGLMNCKSEWVLMTGDDNYYVPKFIQEFTDAINSVDNCGFVFCNMVHDHKKYQVIDSRIERKFIDIGNFISKTELGKTIGFKFRDYGADWHYINAYQNKYKNDYKFIKLNKILYVHN